ncbi:MAG: chromosome segregation protein SMC, partial [Ruminococcaceae bacterium]|nr:chromosome segregation protein SMC [Oscillospiraceae bacterium]
RYKKIEAERNLHAAEENLVRLTDINSELESRIGPLENESKKAHQYLELYETKKATDIAIWTYDIANIKSKFDEIDLKYKLAKNDYDDSELELNALEKKSEEAFNRSQENKYIGEQTGVRIAEFTQKKHEIESENRVLENDIGYLKAQNERAAKDIEEKTLEKEAANIKLEAFNTELSEYRSKLEMICDDQGKNSDDIDRLQEAIDNIGIKISEKDSERENLDEAIVNKKLLLSTLEGSHRSDDARLSEILSETEECKDSIGRLSVLIENTNSSALIYTDKINKINAEKNALSEKRNAFNAEAEKYNQEISSIQVEINTKSHRADTLKRMEELFEGYSNSVRSVMKAAESNELSGICGPVSRIISVDRQYSLAIETCLGANIQNIIVENEDSAKQAINYLKRNNAGRSTFYPLTSIKAGSLGTSVAELRRYRGYIGIANELVSAEKKYFSVVDYLLGKTVVVDDIDNATTLAKDTGYRFRIATLDGQLINAGGSFTGGSAKRDSGMLTRNSEISSLEKQIIQLRKNMDAKKKHSDELIKACEDLSEKISECEENAALTSVMLNAENTQIQVYKAECANIEKRLESLNADLCKLDSDKASFDSEYKKISDAIASLEKDVEVIGKEYTELKESSEALEKELSDAYDLNNALILEASQVKNDIYNTEKSINSQTELICTLNMQLDSAKESMDSTKMKLESIGTTVKNNREAYEKLISEIREMEERKKKLSEETEKFEILINELRVKIKDCTHKRESLFQVYTKLESTREKIIGEQDILTAKLWDEYELSYSAARESDNSGICEENYKDFVVKQNELKGKLKRLGPVNVNAINEYKEVKERYEFLSAQIKDLTSSRENLLNIISKLEGEMRVKFSETFEQINVHFKRVFKELFGGGHAEIVLSDPTDVLSSGVEINVAPPGKIINNINLLSGGEKAFVAIALFFAILNVNPSPFCILDEIESALDEVNVSRFAEYSKYYSDNTQFIIITHRRGTMESADTLYGVTMQERGISTILSIDVKNAESKMGVKLE